VGYHYGHSHLTLVLFAVAVGALAFGLVADSWAAAAVGFAIIIVAAASLPLLRRVAVRVEGQRTKTGMEALVGQRGSVVRWEGAAGTVRLQGSLWNAVGAALAEGDEAEVVGWTGSTIEVARATSQSGTNREQA
jgi:membrane protein implicated in regulation of membrane protease activity